MGGRSETTVRWNDERMKRMFHKIKANICPPHSIGVVSNESGSNTALVDTVVVGDGPRPEGLTGTGEEHQQAWVVVARGCLRW